MQDFIAAFYNVAAIKLLLPTLRHNLSINLERAGKRK